MNRNTDEFSLSIKNLPFAFAYHQLITDDQNNPVDYIFLEVNPAFETITGLKRSQIINKKVTEVLPGIEMNDFNWIVECGRVALSGQAEHFVGYSEPLKRWYELSVYSDKPGYFGAFFNDISERKQAEEALINSEANYRLLAENMGDVVWIMDLELNATYISPSCQRVFGFTPEERMQQTIEQRMPPASIALMISKLQEQLAKGDQGNSDHPILVHAEYYHKNGHTIWMESLINALKDRSGKIIGIYGSSRDISERKLAEEQINKLATIVDIAPNSITVHDTEGNFLYANERTFTMHGYEKDEFMRINLKELDTPDSAKLIASRMKEIKEKGESSFEVRHRRKDGSTFPLQIFVKKIDWFGKPALLSIATDITERKKTEKTLAESENRFQKMLGLIPDMISIHDTEMNIIYSNWQGFAAVPEDKRLLNTKCYKTYRDHDQICHDCQAGVVIKSKKPFQKIINIIEGTWYDLRVIPLLNDDGEVEFFMEWVRDISDLKTIENEIRTLNRELEQRVRERTIELEAVNKELTSFAYSVSHDFRAPLRALDAFSATLTESYASQLDEKGLHYLDRIRKAAIYMSNLVDDLLKLSRITRADLKIQTIELSNLTQDIIKTLQETEPERQIAIIINPGLTARGDLTLVQAALENLIDNAWKFSAREPLAEIEFGSTRIDDEEVFFVRDNGVGFNMAYAGKLFGAFQRLHGVNEFPGTGIGLATVQRIINRHGGRVWADSEPSKGATFYFTLPD